MDWRRTFLLVSLVVLHTGCQSWSPFKSKKNLEQLAGNANPIANKSQANDSNRRTLPARVAVVWKEQVYQPNSGIPVRGFTGRFYFYDTQDQLVGVDGELRVYGYDDTKSATSRIADQVFVFPAEKFAKHYSPSDLGPSYNFWIPWEEYGGLRKAITLVPVFKTVDGQIIQGNPDHLSLKGRAPEVPKLQRTIVSQSTEAMVPVTRSSQSVPIPKTIAERMAAMPQQRQQALQRRQQQLDNMSQDPNGAQYNQVQRSRNTSQGVAPLTNRTLIQPFGNKTVTNFSDANSEPVTAVLNKQLLTGEK